MTCALRCVDVKPLQAAQDYRLCDCQVRSKKNTGAFSLYMYRRVVKNFVREFNNHRSEKKNIRPYSCVLQKK